VPLRQEHLFKSVLPSVWEKLTGRRREEKDPKWSRSRKDICSIAHISKCNLLFHEIPCHPLTAEFFSGNTCNAGTKDLLRNTCRTFSSVTLFSKNVNKRICNFRAPHISCFILTFEHASDCILSNIPDVCYCFTLLQGLIATH